MLLDFRENIPSFVDITGGRYREVNILDVLLMEAGTIYIMEHGYLIFLTNHFKLLALLVAELYFYRWKVELFFKWIKQHLRTKSFYGTSENAVKTQIWIAIRVYVLVAIIKKQLRMECASTQFYRF